MSFDYLFTKDMDETTKQKVVWNEVERSLKLAINEILRLKARVKVLEEQADYQRNGPRSNRE